MILSLSQHIEPRAKERPPGYVEKVLSMATRVDGDDVELSEKAYEKLRKLYTGGPKLTELISNFAGAMAKWASAGFPTVTREQFDARHETCSGCENWSGSKCYLCGCAEQKLWLSTERCPVEKWPEIPA